MILSFDTFKGRFNYRVAGIVIKDGKILLNRVDKGGNWFLPGGRVELGESSLKALHREFKEEINCTIKVIGLKYVVENFFEYSRKVHHEIGIYYEIDLDLSPDIKEFFGQEDYGQIDYCWFSREEFMKLDFRPKVLKDKLFDPNFKEIHIIVEI